ncbi:MAG: hypothetical protein P8M16_11520 [Acidimicrobiales bacterium]|nr:hypothetical protein [Acidimicrobiales bacterium]
MAASETDVLWLIDTKCSQQSSATGRDAGAVCQSGGSTGDKFGEVIGHGAFCRRVIHLINR